MRRNVRIIIAIILAIILIAIIRIILVTLGFGNDAETPQNPISQSSVDAPPVTVTDIGHGEVVFRFEVIDNEGVVAAWNVSTDDETVGAALLTAGLISGETSAYGLLVTEVNGIAAVYDTDKAYWAFYVDGEYATAGVDATQIERDKTYAFVYTKA